MSDSYAPAGVSDAVPILRPAEAKFQDGPSPNVEGLFVIHSRPGVGAAKLDFVPYGEAYIGSLDAPNHTFTRDFAKLASHKSEDILIVAVMSGSLQGIASSGPLAAGPNEVAMIDLSEVLLVETLDLVATIWLLPRSIANSKQLSSAWWHGYVLPSTHKVTHLVATMMHEATRLCRSSADPAENALIDPVIVMLASVLRSEQANALGHTQGAHSSSALAAVKRYINEHLADPDLSVVALAREFGMSRASLYREFASFGGIAEYIRRQRLQRAQHELRARGDQPLRLSALAHKLGFKSAASLSRSFTAAFGMPPRQFKHQAIARLESRATAAGSKPESAGRSN